MTKQTKFKIMELELKHLAAYLPYDVLVRSEVGNHWNHRDEIMRAPNLIHYEHQKMYLRPLSDLTKEITVNGETFVPIEFLKNNYIGEMMGLNISTWSNRVVEKLLEWHFDIFRLIPAGLAIDINTLNE